MICTWLESGYRSGRVARVGQKDDQQCIARQLYWGLSGGITGSSEKERLTYIGRDGRATSTSKEDSRILGDWVIRICPYVPSPFSGSHSFPINAIAFRKQTLQGWYLNLHYCLATYSIKLWVWFSEILVPLLQEIRVFLGVVIPSPLCRPWDGNLKHCEFIIFLLQVLQHS